MFRLSTVLLAFVVAVAASCAGNGGGNVEDDDPAVAALASFRLWGIAAGREMRDLSAAVISVDGDRGEVRVTGLTRDSSSSDWRRLTIVLPVQRGEAGTWEVPPLSAVDRLIRAYRAATAVSVEQAGSVRTRTAAPAIPSATPVTVQAPALPPPPEGVVLYTSDWLNGLDGWIGAPDWRVENGRLLNDGTDPGREPWLEAPVVVETWQSMIVEFEAEAPAADFGSFGLIARGGRAGWYEIGVRWEDFARGSGVPVATFGAAIRQETRLERQEFLAVRKPLTAGSHLYRVEFRDGEVRLLIDGQEIGVIPAGQFYAGEFLGLWSDGTPLKITFFRITLQ